MKPGIHPDYHPVVFQDATTGAMFLTRSTIPVRAPSSGRRRTACAPIHLSSSTSPRIRTRSGPAGAVSSTAPDKWKNSTAATAAGNHPHPNATPTPRSEFRIARRLQSMTWNAVLRLPIRRERDMSFIRSHSDSGVVRHRGQMP